MKIKETNAGNIKMTLTPEEFDLFRLVLSHVRLGNRNESVRTVSDMAIAMEQFKPVDLDYDRVWFTKETPYGCEPWIEDVTIEID
jgi:hypothetical protein